MININFKAIETVYIFTGTYEKGTEQFLFEIHTLGAGNPSPFRGGEECACLRTTPCLKLFL